jgi:LysM repeat protein
MSLEKAVITNRETREKIPVHFNPEEYTLNRDINYAQTNIPGLSGPVLQFVNGNMETLEMELLVDTFEEHKVGNISLNQAREDVRNLTTKITGLMDIYSETHAPPVLIFSWGSLVFTCVLARVSQRFILFRPDGVPLRARLSVTFNKYIDPEREAKEVNRQTADFSKVHTVHEGETVARLATRYYENPQQWRPIAIANGLLNPRQIVVGQQLIIPSLPFVDPESGEEFV